MLMTRGNSPPMYTTPSTASRKRSTAEAMLFLENEYFEDYTDLYSDDEVKDRYKEFLEKYGYGDMAEYIR